TKGPMPDTVLNVKALSATNLTLEAVGAPAGQSINLMRVGAAEDGARLLLGSWTMPADMGGQKVSNNWHFRADGTAVFTVPFKKQVGTYKLTAAGIHLEVPQSMYADGPVSWEGPVMVLQGRRSPTKLRRF
ncbi:MAG: hypothetical protein ABI823_03295, partial [Bryobacteraceae bacterium]